MKKRYQLILILTIIGSNVFSQSDFQKGYVQINEHDTIWGLINYKNDKSNHNVCFFKGTECDTVLKFIPGNIFGYKFSDGKYYVSREIADDNGTEEFFLEYLVKGPVDLYFYRDSFDHYLLQKHEMPLKEISYDNAIINADNKQYYRENMINRGMLRYYLQDCPEIFEDIERIVAPSHSELIQLVKKYHDIKCPNDACIIYKRSLPKFRMDLQPVFGITKAGKEYVMDSYAKTDYTYQLGILTYIWLPMTNERMFIKSGVLYSKIKELDNVTFDKNGNPYDFVYGNYTHFKIPIQFQYVFLKHMVSPTFGVGVNVLIAHKDLFPIIPAFNVGLNVKLRDNLYISLSADIDYFGEYYIIPNKTTFVVSNSFSCGVTLKI